MRRSKVESEFKVRALNAQLSEAQLAEQGLSKEISCKKMSLVALDKKMTEVRDKKQVNMINRTVQLVVKRGAIEVDLSGRLVDFEDAILISKAEVDDINNMIRRAGAKKLAAMNNAAIFRRKVLHKEWEHQGEIHKKVFKERVINNPFFSSQDENKRHAGIRENCGKV